jgi:hypothetical protein
MQNVSHGIFANGHIYEMLGASGVRIIGRHRNLCGAQKPMKAHDPQYFIYDVVCWVYFSLFILSISFFNSIISFFCFDAKSLISIFNNIDNSSLYGIRGSYNQ